MELFKHNPVLTREK